MKNKALFTAAVMVLLSLFIKDMPAQSVVVGGTNLNIGSGNLLTSDGNQGVCGNAVGNNDTIGIYSHGSIALGVGNNITGVASMAFGCAVKLAGNYGIGIGHHVRVTGTSGCMVIGNGIIGPGTDNNAYLVNANNNSLAVGFKSTKPTLFVSESPNNYSQGILDRTGRVAIGDVTPQAKLHIRSDVGEDAGLILVPADPTDNSAFIQLHDDRHRIIVNSSGEMSVSAGSSNAMGITSSNLNVEGGVMRIGSYFNNLHLSAEGTPYVSSNAYMFEGSYYSITQDPSYTIEFGSTGVRLRTATNKLPRERNIVENWIDALFVKTNGAITLNGQVGINQENTYPGYALAVDGGILTTKVHIQDVNEWQDRVFGKDYDLMPLEDLEAYVSANRHLPGVPSEAEVRANGYDVAEMQSVLLGKIEELTLHVIRQQKEIDSLRTLVSVHFGYDACGNRVSRTLEFARMEDPGVDGDDEPNPDDFAWQASLSDTFLETETVLFPNPTEGGFILSFTGGEKPQGVSATLCTMDGKILEERVVSSNTEAFDLVGKPAGIYLLRLASDRETKVWKVVKRN